MVKKEKGISINWKSAWSIAWRVALIQFAIGLIFALIGLLMPTA